MNRAPRGTFCWSGQLYLVWKEADFKLGITHKPGLDFSFWTGRGYQFKTLLATPLSLATAYFLWERLTRSLSFLRTSPAEVELLLAGEIKKGLRLLKLATGFSKAPETLLAPPAGSLLATDVCWPAPAELENIRRTLSGRILYREELDAALAEMGLRPLAPLEDSLQILALSGEITLIPAVGLNPRGEPFCNRCGQAGSLKLVSCAACGGPCFICEECLSMGLSRSCRPLYASPGGRAVVNSKMPPDPGFKLTPAQTHAAAELKAFVRRRSKRECLLWAACGAGKTEVAFGAIATALERGDEVLYATPRREVVRELAPRLRGAFGPEQVAALHGGSTSKFRRAPLTLATTHQAIRYFRRFGLVVLDEIDAFPFRQNPMLHYAVDRARLEDGQIIYLTATPPEGLVRRLRRQGEIVYLPARHHGYPLPEPYLLAARKLDARRPWLVPGEAEAFLSLSREEDKAQVLVFVPAVEMVAGIAAALAGSGRVAGCSAADPERDEKLAAFRHRQLEVLVTTTLLERGLTLERINVLVLFADVEEIFDVNTLVQIAGRVGRTLSYPHGRVWFVGRRISPAMTAARARIREFNLLAARRGYLRPGTYKL
ncbi:MAG: competence protein ComFA [Clostridia bacterium]|nr:competence protein ComFA [Clostridia bacterium]